MVPPTGQPTPQNNPPAPSFRHSRHYIQCTHRRTFNAQYILPYNVHAQQSNLGNTRSPVTSRPLNGHFAITLFPLTHWRSQLAFFLKSLTFVNIHIVPIYPSSWAVSWASSRMHSLVMGRTSSVSRRRTRAECTRRSGPLYVSITRPECAVRS